MDSIERQRAAKGANHPEWADLPATVGDAWRKDVTQYFTGKPCPKGHVAPKGRGNGRCIECRREADREYQQTPQAKAYMRKYMRERYHRLKSEQ